MAQYTYIYREIAGYKGFLKDSEPKGTAAEMSSAVVKEDLQGRLLKTVFK